MLFMVPDDVDEPVEEQEETDSGSAKAQLDDGEPVLPATGRKVELDLDDAPFLEDEEDEEEEFEAAGEDETPALESEKKSESGPWYKNKILILGVVIILLLTAILVKLFLFPSSAPPPEKKPEQPAQVEEPVAPPPEPEPEQPPETILRMEPFWVEQSGDDESIRFLVVRLALSTTNPVLARDLQRETLLVRNAVYYYLKNKDLNYLTDKKNAEALKDELLTVINQYMSSGAFETLLFEQYLVK